MTEPKQEDRRGCPAESASLGGETQAETKLKKSNQIIRWDSLAGITLAWKIPWMEELGRLQSMGSLRVGPG